ncbi:MAG: zinc metallopeptidase [Planctomycetota bacterium]
MFFDPLYFVFLAPALLLAMLAQILVAWNYRLGKSVGARMSGYAAARQMLDVNGLYDVGIEQVPGHLSDHYDPSDRVLRLSPEVYHGQTASAVGIAAHEAGHALQHAFGYAPLVIRNAAVPIANFGSSFGMVVLMIGLALGLKFLAWAGVLLFAAVAFFQIVNLPVEFDASARAKVALVELGIVDRDEQYYVRKVLNAAALTYVAATLQSVLTLLYYLVRLGLFSSRSDD